MKSTLAVIAAKIVLKLNRLFKKGGTALPGLVAQKIDPTILDKLARNNFPKGIIVITGTNGKTTTASLVASILESYDISYIHNRTGSNLERGIISSLIEQSDFKGQNKADMGLFEVDEAFIPIVCKKIKPTLFVVTNLFRDQLDRYGELDNIAKSFLKVMTDLDYTKFFLNADDPLVASLAADIKDKSKLVFYGVNSYNGPKIVHDYTADSIFSPISQEPLIYTKRYFGHIGVYKSRNNDFVRPKPNFAVDRIKQTDNKTTFVVNNTTITINLIGLYNVYNSLAAYAIGSELKIPEKILAESLKNSSVAFGRAETIRYRDRDLLLLLIKNPTGFNQIIQTYLLGDNTRPLLVVINDNFADGRDISWLWDSAIEDLKGYKGKIIASGTRAYDMALRFKYAGIDSVEIVESITKSLQKIIEESGKRSLIYVLPTYTALLKIRKLLIKDSGKEEFWQ